MQKSEITHDMILECFRYNPETGILYWRKRKLHWFKNVRSWRSWNGKFAGKAALNNIYTNKKERQVRRGTFQFKPYLAHHIIWFFMTGQWPSPGIDHKDRDSLNNRWSNLKEATHDENMKNLSMRKDNTIGVVGVYKRKRSIHYQASITVNKKYIHLGHFRTLEEAVKARKYAEKEHGFSEGHGSIKR